jgi:DNA-binding transcriptional MerR regulator
MTMPLRITEKLTKRYYSIGEVADLLGVSKSMLRYWEAEFPDLKPHKNGRGDRRFTPDNIHLLVEIHNLVKDRGFTLEGARKELDRRKNRDKEHQACLDRLREIRAGLLAIRAMF